MRTLEMHLAQVAADESFAEKNLDESISASRKRRSERTDPESTKKQSLPGPYFTLAPGSGVNENVSMHLQ